LRKVYLDHAATTPVAKEVVEAMMICFSSQYGNPSSLHSFGREAKVLVEDAREKVAKLIGADPSEIVFTSGGTESDNFALKGVAYANLGKGKHIITSQIEHHAILNPCNYLEKQDFKVTYLPVDSYGRVDPEEVRKNISKETILISIMQANNEVGTIQPIMEIGKIAKEYGVYFHTDAVQSVGKLPIDVNQLGVDLLSLSGHKIYGPKGVGALYIRKGTRIQPQVQGGHHERNRRAGTENVPGIVGLGKACELAESERGEEWNRLVNLRQKLYQGIAEKVAWIRRNGHPEESVPGILSICFEYIEGESLILNLDLKGIAVSSGSACTSGSLEPSHVLKAMGVPPVSAQGSIRFSLGRENTEEEIDYVLEVLPEIVERLRRISPLYENAMKKK